MSEEAQIVGRVLVSGLVTLAVVGIWLGMMGDVWKWGPFATKPTAEEAPHVR
jgi:hypothetical protein